MKPTVHPPPVDLEARMQRFYAEAAKRPARRPIGPILTCSSCKHPDFGVRHVGDTCAACAADDGPDDPYFEQIAEAAVQALGADVIEHLLRDHLERNAQARELLTP